MSAIGGVRGDCNVRLRGGFSRVNRDIEHSKPADDSKNEDALYINAGIGCEEDAWDGCNDVC